MELAIENSTDFPRISSCRIAALPVPKGVDGRGGVPKSDDQGVGEGVRGMQWEDGIYWCWIFLDGAETAPFAGRRTAPRKRKTATRRIKGRRAGCILDQEPEPKGKLESKSAR
jgi:hypothetical protein